MVSLKQLTSMKKMIISLVRAIQMVLKIQYNNMEVTDRLGFMLRGHYIMFGHDAHSVAAGNFLNLETWSDCFVLRQSSAF